ncbi:hypothetical protein [Rummeliibacillus stabekisii]|uniref:Uncharacterized protein n=1 Tax=Rummeliibacillus stabekisii TaxID=241244 RepID=A0A143HF37_9BACL|nr:hypothetical protein [Rummeliibacillus stabekisii]AMX00358.1 hypothetical protein ATY39_13620 [Rummeliibacillus stabekisii]
MKELLKEDMDNLFNVGVGNQFDFVGCYMGEKGSYLIDRTDGQTYTDDFQAESKDEAIKLLFEKVEEMIDEFQIRLSNYYSEMNEGYPDENFEEELKEKLDNAALTALYKIQRYDLKSYFSENELQLAELMHKKLVERYELKEVKDIDFNYYK